MFKVKMKQTVRHAGHNQHPFREGLEYLATKATNQPDYEAKQLYFIAADQKADLWIPDVLLSLKDGEFEIVSMTIQEWCEQHQRDGYGHALIDGLNRVVTPYVDASDFIDLWVNPRGQASYSPYSGWHIVKHSGCLETEPEKFGYTRKPKKPKDMNFQEWLSLYGSDYCFEIKNKGEVNERMHVDIHYKNGVGTDAYRALFRLTDYHFDALCGSYVVLYPKIDKTLTQTKE
jgi:hypothetical protein